MTSPPPTTGIALPILEDNPYTGHPDLTQLEADVLWEYAKMAGLVKQVCLRFVGAQDTFKLALPALPGTSRLWP